MNFFKKYIVTPLTLTKAEEISKVIRAIAAPRPVAAQLVVSRLHDSLLRHQKQGFSPLSVKKQ